MEELRALEEVDRRQHRLCRGFEHVERCMASARCWIVVLRKKSDSEQQVMLFCSH